VTRHSSLVVDQCVMFHWETRHFYLTCSSIWDVVVGVTSL